MKQLTILGLRWVHRPRTIFLGGANLWKRTRATTIGINGQPSRGSLLAKKMIQWMSSTEMPGRECEKMMRSCIVWGAKAWGVVISSATQWCQMNSFILYIPIRTITWWITLLLATEYVIYIPAVTWQKKTSSKWWHKLSFISGHVAVSGWVVPLPSGS